MQPYATNCLVSVPLLLASALLLAAADDVSLLQPTEHTVKMGQLEVEWNGDLRLNSTRSHGVNADTAEWGRSAEIADIGIRDGHVVKGDVIMTLDTTDIDEAIEDARTALAELNTRQDIAKRTREIEAESMATSLEQDVKSEERARRDLALFNEFRSKMQREQQAMSFERSGHYVEDQSEELQQLEAMYGDTTLADRTKDIVLQRAKRSLDMAQRSYAHTTINNDLWTKYTFPDREMDMNDSFRWKSQKLDHTKIRQQLTRMRWELDVAREVRDRDDAEEKLNDLLADRELFTIKAPMSGILTKISLDPGDDVGMRQDIAQIHDLSAAELQGTIDARMLTVLETGANVTVEFDAFPGMSLPGTIDSIGLIGTPSGSSTSFPIAIALRGEDPRLRLGLACSATTTRTLKNVIAIPLEAIRQDGDRTYVMVREGENTVERDVTTGHENKEAVEVVSGLSVNDVILISSDESKQ